MKILFLTSDRGISNSELLFRKEVIKTSGVEIYPFGKGYENGRMRITEKIESVGGVDVILTSVSWRIQDGWTVLWEECFKKAKALKVSIAPDFYKGAKNMEAYMRHYDNVKFDIVFGYGTEILDHLKKMNVGRWHYFLTHGVDTEVFRKHDVEKVIDILATYATYTSISDIYTYGGMYNARAEIQERLAKMRRTSCVGRIPFFDIAKITNISRIVVNTFSRHNFINPRVTETMACGSFLLNSYCDDLIRFGYKDGEHLVTFGNMKDFLDKTAYFLKHGKEREEIAENGMKFVRSNYSNKNRVETMFDRISQHL